MDFVDDCIVDSEEQDLSSQLLQVQKNQISDSQENFERYCSVLLVLGVNGPKYGLNLIKSCLLPTLVNERVIQPAFLKKVNQFVSFKFEDIQLLDILNFPRGATSLDSFLKTYKTKETKRFFPSEWFDCTGKLTNKEIRPYDSFFNILRNSCPLERDYSDLRNIVHSGLSREQALAQIRMDDWSKEIRLFADYLG